MVAPLVGFMSATAAEVMVVFVWFLFFKIVSFDIFLKLILFFDKFSMLSVRLCSEMKNNFGTKLFFVFLCFLYPYFFKTRNNFQKQ